MVQAIGLSAENYVTSRTTPPTSAAADRPTIHATLPSDLGSLPVTSPYLTARWPGGALSYSKTQLINCKHLTSRLRAELRQNMRYK